MEHEMAPPVKALLHAMARGVQLVESICQTASQRSVIHQLDVLPPAQALEISLAYSEVRIREDYYQKTKAFGGLFGDVLVVNQETNRQMRAVTINLTDHISSISTYFDDPEGFDFGSFKYVQRESTRCCELALEAMDQLRTAMLQAGAQRFQLAQQAGPVDQPNAVVLQVEPPATEAAPESGVPVELDSTEVISPVELDSAVVVRTPPLPEKSERRIVADSKNKVSPAESAPVRPEPKALATLSIDEVDRRASLEVKPLFTTVSGPSMQPPNKRSENKPPRRSMTISRKAVNSGSASGKSSGPPRQLIERAELVREVSSNEELIAISDRQRLAFELDHPAVQDDVRLLTEPVNSGNSMPPPAYNSPEHVSNPEFQMAAAQAEKEKEKQLPPSPVDSASDVEEQASQQENTAPATTEMESQSDIPTPAEKEHVPHQLDSQGTTKDEEQKTETLAPTSAPSEVQHIALMDVRRLAEHAPFTPPSTPPGGESHCSVSTKENGAPFLSLNLPTFGRDINTALDAVDDDDDDDKISISEDVFGDTPPMSLKSSTSWNSTSSLDASNSTESVERLVQHNATFLKHGGFCEGAKMEFESMQKAVKSFGKPTGQLTDVTAMKCAKCSFEIGSERHAKDVALDKEGIYTLSGVRFRQQFLSKSHLPTKSREAPTYACVFCVDAQKTPYDHDATTFFSPLQLFAHLQRHVRPLPPAEGIKVLYGRETDEVDFDINFVNDFPTVHPFLHPAIAKTIEARPSGHARVNYNPKVRGFRESGPNGHKTLQFAVGARIVGIKFPRDENGVWAHGYHDGRSGMFPTSAIVLTPPPSAEHTSPDPMSPLTATATWDFKTKTTPSNPASTAWLTFSRKDKIIHVSRPTNEKAMTNSAWCWAGMNTKGKWGLFPKDFVGDVVDGDEKAPQQTAEADSAAAATTAQAPSAKRSSSESSRSMGMADLLAERVAASFKKKKGKEADEKAGPALERVAEEAASVKGDENVAKDIDNKAEKDQEKTTAAKKGTGGAKRFRAIGARMSTIRVGGK